MLELKITELASGGNGLAKAEDKLYFVPYGLPGDTVLAQPITTKDHQIWASIIDIVTPSLQRVTPPCPYFTLCGGCQLQQLDAIAYQTWKVHLVTDRLRQAGMNPETIHPPVFIPPGTRRRVTLCAQRDKGKIVLGFNRHHSDEVVDLEACLVMRPELAACLPALRHLMASLLQEVKQLDIGLTLLDSGVDVLITGDLPLNLLTQEAIGEFVNAHKIVRFSLRVNERAEPEVLLQPHPARLMMGDVAVDFTSGGFLQPSREGETALINAVLGGIGPAAHVADLFCGAGTFTFPIAKQATVHAVDADGPAIRSLARAAHGLSVTSESRNLYKKPLSADELKKFDAIVFDPPRAGAKAQAPMIAASGVRTVVAVSCNPATFAVDAKPLLESGYKFSSLRVVDQFTWSSHVELVAVFERD